MAAGESIPFMRSFPPAHWDLSSAGLGRERKSQWAGAGGLLPCLPRDFAITKPRWLRHAPVLYAESV